MDLPGPSGKKRWQPSGKLTDGQSQSLTQRAPLRLQFGAPVAHVLVSSLNVFKSPRAKRMIWAGVIASSVGAVVTRMWLMADSGYPGAEKKSDDRFVTDAEAHKSLKWKGIPKSYRKYWDYKDRY